MVLLSDGTGNSAGKLQKTNVWRLYQALDLASDADWPTQIACYNDGVGTSSFRPLALLGGAFGWGLKRNVLHLYEFLCRNYQPGDRIYLFGFSRGAFTVRILASLILREGLVRCPDRDFPRYARAAYRVYRSQRFTRTTRLVLVLRRLRDAVVRVYRRLLRQAPYAAIPRHRIEAIELVGVWDTVAAYGTPFAELTRGIDRWVWPLSMPNYVLHERVQAGRHALALDDQRDTFHPLLWDELAEQQLVAKGKVRPGRLKQVWFAGMHADVGGGYADDGMSVEPLHWMMREAAALELRFAGTPYRIEPPVPSRSAPMHDSRRGLAAYYRYQPRRIAAWLDPPDPDTRIMRNPFIREEGRKGLRGKGLLSRVVVHESVIERIAAGIDDYAPLVLPETYSVMRRDGVIAGRPETAEQATRRIAGSALAWNDVWRKRAAYFASVGVALLLVAFPLLDINGTPGCEGAFCVIAPLIQAVGVMLPAIADPWIDAYAYHPALFALAILALALLQLRSTVLTRRIDDRMRGLWAPLAPGPVRMPRGGKLDPLVEGVRTSDAYQTILRTLKWRALPFAAGWTILLAGTAAVFVTLATEIGRTQLAGAERSGRICTLAGGAAAADGVARVLAGALCNDTGLIVEKGRRYLIRFDVIEPWSDRSIVTDPTGFASSRAFVLRLAVPLRRSVSGAWLQPFLSIVPARHPGGRTAPVVGGEARPLDPRLATGGVYQASFIAPASGQVRLWVNDAPIALWPTWSGGFLTGRFYANNRGVADVTLTPLEQPGSP